MTMTMSGRQPRSRTEEEKKDKPQGKHLDKHLDKHLGCTDEADIANGKDKGKGTIPVNGNSCPAVFRFLQTPSEVKFGNTNNNMYHSFGIPVPPWILQQRKVPQMSELAFASS